MIPGQGSKSLPTAITEQPKYIKKKKKRVQVLLRLSTDLPVRGSPPSHLAPARKKKEKMEKDHGTSLKPCVSGSIRGHCSLGEMVFKIFFFKVITLFHPYYIYVFITISPLLITAQFILMLVES